LVRLNGYLVVVFNLCIELEPACRDVLWWRNETKRQNAFSPSYDCLRAF